MNDKIYQLLRGNNYELALKELEEILKNSDKSHHGSIYTLMGLCQRNLGQTANAKKSFTRALKTSPKSDAYLCNMGLVLIDEQDYHHALYFLNKSLKVNPKNFNAIENKIIVSANTAPLDQTLRLIDHQPDFNSAKRIFLTAYAYQKNNQFEQAIKLYIQASKYPEYQIAGLFSAISMFVENKKFQEALALTEKILENNRNNVQAIITKAHILSELRRSEDVIDTLKAKIKNNPHWAEGFNLLGLAWMRNNEYDKALLSLNSSIELKETPENLTNLGITLSKLGRDDDAVNVLTRCIKTHPSYTKAYVNLGTLFNATNRPTNALKTFEMGLKVKPKDELLTALLLATARDLAETGIMSSTEYNKNIGTGYQAIPPLSLMPLEDDPMAQLMRARVYTKTFFPRVDRRQPRLNQPENSDSGKIKIAYISGDFHDFPSMHLLRGVFKHHDRKKFHLLAFSYGLRKDEMTDQVAEMVDDFVDISALTDKEAINLINNFDPDIAIDLNGYTKGARTKLFSYRISPVQISFLGYPGSMGANFMDYIIADSVVIPTNFDKYYDEKVIRVPNSFFPYDDQQYRPSKSQIEARAIDGLPTDKFVFANFNRPQKNTLEDYMTWAQILRTLPGSYILLYAKSKVAQANLIKFFNAQSISQDRIIFASYVQNRDEHFERLRAPDLMLDSFNYNGHTTTADALWSGLPVLTKMGNQFAARVSASLLRGLGLDELIVSNQIDYIHKAITLANNPEYLIQIRQVLNSPQRNKNLFNTKDYTLRLEEAYENVISSNSTS